VRHSGFWIFLVGVPHSCFFTQRIFLVQGKVTVGEKISPTVTPYSVKNFTGMVIGIEKINRSFGSQ
jgi:hypothetical protein